MSRATLTDRSWSGKETISLLGPEDLSFNDVAAIVTAVLGTPVRYQQVPFEGFAGQLAGYGMPASYVQAIVEMMKAKNEAIYNAPPRIADPAMPTTFRQWCEDTLAPAARA